MDSKTDKLTRTEGNSTKMKRHRISVYLGSEERIEKVRYNARKCGYMIGGKVRLSAYVRDRALNYTPVAIVNYDLLEELRKTSFNIARLGTLIKWAIFTDPPHDLDEIKRVVGEVIKAKEELLILTRKIESSIRRMEPGTIRR